MADKARAAAFNVLQAVSNDDAFANLVLPRQLADAGLTGRDAALATELSYGTLRASGTLDEILRRCATRGLDDVDTAVLNLLRLGAYQLRFAEVAPHWDRLILRAWAVTDGKRELYQESAVSSMLPPAILIQQYTGSDALPEGFAMFSGTLPAIGGLRPAQRFEFELEDPVLGRSLRHGYSIRTLPIVG